MQVAHETFRRWMIEHASNDGARKLIDDNLYEMRWIFDLAETGQHRLARAEDLDLPGVARSIRLATDHPIWTVLPISLSDLLSFKPKWMPESVYQQALHGSYGRGLFDFLRDRHQYARRERGLTEPLLRMFSETLRTLEAGSPWNRYWGWLRTLLGPVENVASGNYWYALRLFCEALLSDDRLMVGELSPLISKTLRRTMPLGQKRDEPDVFLVLTA